MAKTTTLYLRGIPVDVVRAAKAAAALRGKTLGVVVADALRSSLDHVPSSSTLDADMDWFAKHRAALVKKYPDQYVAIVDSAVVDHDDDFAVLAERAFERYGDRPIFMPRVRRTDRPLRIRSPRRVK